MRMVEFQVKLPQTMKDALDALSARTKVPISAYVRRGIARELQHMDSEAGPHSLEGFIPESATPIGKIPNLERARREQRMREAQEKLRDAGLGHLVEEKKP